MVVDGSLAFSSDFPDSELAGGCVDLPTEKPIRIGRLPECEIQLRDNRFSRIQATLYRRFSRWSILDGGIYEPSEEPRASVNGVWLNGGRLAPGDDRPLAYGDRICFGVPEAKILFTEDCDLTLVPELFTGPGWPEFKPATPLAETDPDLLAALQTQQQPPEAEAEAEPPRPSALEADSLWEFILQLLTLLASTPQGFAGFLNRVLLILLIGFALLIFSGSQLLHKIPWSAPQSDEGPSRLPQ